MSGAIAMAIRQCLRAGTRRRGAVLHGRGGGGGKRMVRRSGGEMGDWIGWLGVWGRVLYKLEARRGKATCVAHIRKPGAFRCL